MTKLIIVGFQPLEKLIRLEIEQRKDSIDGLIIQELTTIDVLNNPTYINHDDVVICGFTVYKTFKEIGVRGHLVPIRVQFNDLVSALLKAKEVGDFVHVIVYKNPLLLHDIEKLEKLFKIKIYQHTFSKKDEIYPIIAGIKNMNNTTIIGAGLVTNVAESKGIHAVSWYGKESIGVAVNTAFNILKAIFDEISNSKRMNYIIDNFYDGVIITDEIGKIINVNNNAIQLLKLQEYHDHLQGVQVDRVLESDEIIEILTSKIEIKSRHIRYLRKDLLISVLPIQINKNSSGSVAIISDVNVLQENESKVRKKLYSDVKSYTKYQFKDIIGRSPQLTKAKEKAIKFAKTDSNVLIIGETGTGKELFAQSIHKESNRKDQPFIAINCAALPENLLESELFGYSDGAFTGAKKGGKPGLFEQAHNGTIFLDEIGEIPLSMQVKLLRVLQEKVVMRIGTTNTIPIDVRVICATNLNLKKQVLNGDFRKDLYYRIAILNLILPSLNERVDDLSDLILNFVMRQKPEFLEKIRENIVGINAILRNHKWTGNIRELENTFERMFAYLDNPKETTSRDIINSLNESIEESSILFDFMEPMDDDSSDSYKDVVQHAEISQIREALQRTNGNKNEASRLLGISRSTLWRKLKEAESINKAN